MTAARRLDPTPHEDHTVLLRGASWSDYLRLLAVRGEKAVPRITYLEGMIEIMTPSTDHDALKSLLGRLVEIYCLEHDIEFSTVGSWTIKSKERKRGAEPDECYVFGEIGARKEPDLAIEIEWTTRRLDKLLVYAELGVKEVWYWRRGVIETYALRRGKYVRTAKSLALPKLDLAELGTFLAKPGPTSAVMRAYAKALRKKGR